MKIILEISENEYKTLVTALNARGNMALKAATKFAQKHTRPSTGEPYTVDDFRSAMTISERAFKLQRMVQEQKDAK